MADRTYTYKVVVDTASARQQAAQIRRVFERELSNIQTQNTNLVNPQALRNVQQAVQQQAQAQQQATQQIAAAQQQATTQAAAQSQQRVAGSQSEAQARVRNAQNAANQMIAEERRITAQAQAEQQRRQQQSSGGGIAGAVRGGVAAFLTVQTARAVTQYATEAAKLSTQIARSEKAFVTLSGSAETAESRLLAVQRASNGTTDRLAAMNIVTSIAALKMANTAKEFNELARAGRVVTLLSPQIRDFNDALAQLTLFSNSASFARADQLALNPEDVKNLVKELQAADSTLSDSQAKLQASVQLLNNKGGSLLDSLEAQASGYEKLTVAQAEFVQGASAIGGSIDSILRGAASGLDEISVLFGVGSSRAILDTAKAYQEAAKQRAAFVDGVPIVGEAAQRNAASFQYAAETLAILNKGVEDAVPGALEYRTAAESIVVTAARWGFVTEEQTNQLLQISQAFQTAKASSDDYNASTAGGAGIAERQAATDAFLSTLNQISSATKDFGNVDFGNIEGIADWRKELSELRSEFLQTGALTDEQQQRMEFLSRSMAEIAQPTSGLADIQRELGSSFLENNEVAADYVQQILDLNAAYANHKIGVDTFNAGLAQVKAGLSEAAAAAEFSFNAALTRSTIAVAQLDQMVASGTPGLSAWRDELTAIRDEMVSTGTITDEQAARVTALSAATMRATAAQADYGSTIAQLGDAFFGVNERAAEITQQIANLGIALNTGAINADTYAASTNALRNELDGIAANQVNISTEGIDQLGEAITNLDSAVARGLPGADALISQAIAMEQAIASSGGIVTGEQAAQIDAWAASAEAAAVSAETLAAVQAAVGAEVAAADGIIAAMIGSMGELSAQHANGAISSEMFAGAMSVLIARLYELLTAAGLTKAEVDGLIGSLGAIPNVSLTGAGGVLGAQLGDTVNRSLVAQDEARKRREAERLARLQESSAKKAANQWESAMKKAAQELEGALRNVPGLFGRSQVTDKQLNLAKAGQNQNFADDFLRRLEDEINQNADIWPDVSIEQAREALRKVGVTAVDDSKLAFEQLVEAWESGLLFSDKSNLELINAEAVQASIDLQEKTKQGQQNIIDHFKNVVGIAVDAVTGVAVDTSGVGGAVNPKTDKNIPSEITVTASDNIQNVLTNGSVTITTATLSAAAMLDLATSLSAQAFTITIDTVTISAAALQTLSESTLKDMETLKGQIATALQPTIKPLVTLASEDYAVDRESLGTFLNPTVTPNITFDAADILAANDLIAALTPTIKPTLSLTVENQTAFTDAVGKITPGINTHLIASTTELSDYTVFVEDNVPIPGIATTLYTTIEEIQLFKDILAATVKPEVAISLKLEEATDEEGNAVSSFPDIAGQFADAIDKQIVDKSARFSAHGTAIAGYLALAAYNYAFPDIISRYADLIDFQIAATSERLGVQGSNVTGAFASGVTTYVFPDVALQFVEAVELQIRSNSDRFTRQGTNAMNLIVQGMNGFDFSFIATAMVSGVRAGMEQEAIKTALGDVGATAMRTIRDGLEGEAGSISWAGILTAAITESVLSELADTLEGQ